MTSKPNFIVLTDSYKMTHWEQYPENTTEIYSYMESRGSHVEGVKEVTVFGLQYLLKNYFEGQVLESWMIDEAYEVCAEHFGDPSIFNKRGWQRLLEKHHGFLPIHIKAIEEGSVVNCGNALITVQHTDPEFFWLTNHIETLLLQTWYPMTVASISRQCKKVILQYLEKTGDPSLIDYKLHDFGYRGVSSQESACIGGMAHLVNFKGSDTLAGIMGVRRNYGVRMAGNSIAATEHSTITSWGKENEAAAYRNLLKKFPNGLVACVSDSYDIFHACDQIWGVELKDEVMARNGTLVIRPDSGNAVVILPQLLDILWNRFGGTTNEKGYKVLDSHVRLIWGDGINLNTIGLILERIAECGYSADNVAFGMGGALLQMVNRDTFNFAFKCSHAIVNGEAIDVRKTPVTDKGKTSKAGRFSVIREGDKYVTVPESKHVKDELKTVFYNGLMTAEITFDKVRDNAKVS